MYIRPPGHGHPAVDVVAGVLFLLESTLPHPILQPFRHPFRELQHLQVSFHRRKFKVLNGFL
jgi:hypothetical protein